jgi:hypothetical protein
MTAIWAPWRILSMVTADETWKSLAFLEEIDRLGKWVLIKCPPTREYGCVLHWLSRPDEAL